LFPCHNFICLRAEESEQVFRHFVAMALLRVFFVILIVAENSESNPKITSNISLEYCLVRSDQIRQSKVNRVDHGRGQFILMNGEFSITERISRNFFWVPSLAFLEDIALISLPIYTWLKVFPLEHGPR